MKLSICAIFRDEANYLKEWIEFHCLVGVEKFYLYNHRSEDDYLNVLRPYIDSGIVTLTEWDRDSPCQVQAYQHYIDAHVGESDWAAFLDIDEFLFSPQFDSVPEFLSTFPPEWQAVAVSWMCFGSSGKQEWEDAPVIERFTWRKFCSIPSNHYAKPIVRMDKHFTIDDPHYANVLTITPSGRPTSGPHLIPHEYDLLRINHYGTKSRQEWEKRQRFGKPCGGGPSPEACYQEVQGSDVEDLEAMRFLLALKERLSV